MSAPLNSPLIAWTDKGLYCEAGGFYIDPHRAVEVSLTTHAHSDHARRGCKRYVCALTSVRLLKARLGHRIAVEGVEYGKRFKMGEVWVSFHPAGHILGSAQVRVEYRGEVWVASGDYKRDPDPSCEPFEPVECETFITEATFGTPKYQWDKTSAHGRDIRDWWEKNAREGRNSLLFGYSLGKSQRILAELASLAPRPVLIHSSMTELTEAYRLEGRHLAPTLEIDALPEGRELEGELILAPPSILKGPIAERLGEYETAFASGWMQGSNWGHTQSYDHGFVISDHADWTDLNRTIDETRARRVFVQHRDGALIRHLRKRGIEAHPVETLEPNHYARLAPENLSFF